VTYPEGVIDKLRERGKTFQSEESARRDAGSRAAALSPKAKVPPPPSHKPLSLPAPSTPAPRALSQEEAAPTQVDPTMVQEPNEDGYFERTVPSARTPYGGLPDNAPEPEGDLVGLPEDMEPTDVDDMPVVQAATKPARPQAAAKKVPDVKRRGKAGPPARSRLGGCIKRLFLVTVLLLIVGTVAGLAAAGGGYWYFSRDLPTIEALQGYRPPTVTVVYDHKGQMLGEIYEERRYVVPLEEIPEHVQNAFIASEDAKFWEHGGVDYLGLVRAMGKNLREGRLAQGASTITQQVTRNFLLTREKKIQRKIKEILLAWRIEGTYSKEHILYLYLNEIYLGSGAYGVEAASRVYFDKPVKDVTVAEAALLAGLPQRPSDYSPHRHWSKARERQRYALDQMVDNGYLTRAEADTAFAEEVKIVERKNEFLHTAPHVTEYARRYLVDTYGHDRVYNEGLQVWTTCDLDLQKVAQDAVVKGVHDVDQRMGFRREGIETLPDEATIATRRSEIEKEMRAQWARDQDPAGRVEPPDVSILVPGEVYTGVLLEVQRKWARVGIGDHEGVIPMAWSDWVYKPNPKRSWRFRTQDDLTEEVDDDGDRKKDGGILRKGDVVLVKVEALSTREESVAKTFKKTPGEDAERVAVRLWQEPEVEGALMSFDLHTGAVRAMVGGADFETSEFNRAIQARRQVGSTFKPIVYAAAIDSQRMTTASMVTDGPLAYSTDQDFIWKPANYGDDYLGNVTLRKALALSRNTCTVRVLDAIDPGMNEDVVYSFARALGIGGPPTHALPEGWVPSPENDLLCPWVREHKESTICMDHYPPRTDTELSNTRHRRELKPDDVHMCRSCDLSMGLGSASLTMDELMRAYSVFGTNGKLVQPYYIEEVRDLDGNVLEKHEPQEFAQVIDPGVASIMSWLLQGVVREGTGARASKLGLTLAGKTGTTNDEKDTWFVGFNPDVITSAWVGYDQPRTLGISSTGGRTALPIWMDYMRVAIPKENNKYFSMEGDIEWAWIEDETGRRVSDGGRKYPFLEGTVPESTGISAGQLTLEDLTTEL
jgi:penicillin-binding protein 1A